MTKSMKESFEKFVSEHAQEFGYVEINHSSWKTCAVGVFAESINAEWMGVVCKLYDAYGRQESSLMEILNCSGICRRKTIIRTWGDLDRCIRLGVC